MQLVPSSKMIARAKTDSEIFQPIKTATVGWRLDHFILQVGEIERGRVSYIVPIGQIKALLQDKIG